MAEDPASGPAYLVDTNISVRLAKRDDPQHGLVAAAIEGLVRAGADLCYTPQNLVELWNVLTRPKERNGCGLSVQEADSEATLLEKQLTLLPDNEHIHTEWRRLVVAHSVSGKNVHDTRLVAAMIVHGIRQLLTLNTGDFARYREIQAVHPETILR